MKFSILDVFVPGATNMIDMSTEIFRDEFSKSSIKSGLSQRDIINFLIDLEADKLDKLFNEVKKDYIKQIKTICFHNHLLFQYLFRPFKKNDKDRILKVKEYLKSHPKFKNFLYSYKYFFKKKHIYLTRKNLIKEHYIKITKKINDKEFKFYIEFNEMEKIHILEFYKKYKYFNYQSFTIYLLVDNKKYSKLSRTWEVNYN